MDYDRLGKRGPEVIRSDRHFEHFSQRSPLESCEESYFASFQTCGMFMENVKTLQSSKVILVQSWNYISHWMGGNKKFVNPLTPMSDQDRISPYNINTIS